jgi:hypothetical protein
MRPTALAWDQRHIQSSLPLHLQRRERTPQKRSVSSEREWTVRGVVAQEKHYPVRQQQYKRVQENDGHIPDLVLDSLQIENSLQEPLDAPTFLFSVNQDESRYERTKGLKRTHRKIYRNR